MARGQYEPPSDSTTNTVVMNVDCDNYEIEVKIDSAGKTVHSSSWTCDFSGDIDVHVNGTEGVWTCPSCDYEHTIEVDA